MYIIAKMKGGFRAIPVRRTDNWYMYKLRVGRTERRIIMQARGRKYMVYSTNSIRVRHSGVDIEQLDSLCDEIMGELQYRMLHAEEYVDIPQIAEITEKKNVKQWMNSGQLSITSLEAYCGHPLDSATQQLVTHVRVKLSDLIIMDHEPSVDCEQEELPY